ncbi:MAG TPA: hypothetical protein VJM50_01180 [Pyrinomonadaceae bacterium]|nr:hypothetical protein [Pyrinomonadaceae bacterium]
MPSLSRLLEKSLPGLYETLRTARDKRELEQIFAKISANKDLVVEAGPFRGMRYLPRLTASDTLLSHTVVPKLLGSYEIELHDALAAVFERKYRQIINIGSAEGYYAVGLALNMPDVPIYAFDIASTNRELCAEMARINGVADRIFIGAECTMDELARLAEESLIVCDCEGCELELLRPDLIPGLRTSDVVVELHDCVDETISPTILARFAESHDVNVVTKVDRDASSYSAISDLTPLQQNLAMSEFRWGPLLWAFLSAKTRKAPTDGLG